jgi:hypothetical protein
LIAGFASIDLRDEPAIFAAKRYIVRRFSARAPAGS